MAPELTLEQVKRAPMTKEEFANTGWRCTYEEFVACYCPNCYNIDCVHRDAFRRVPKVDGGLALCPNLRNVNKDNEKQ